MTSERVALKPEPHEDGWDEKQYGDNLGEWEPSGTHADAYVDGWNDALAAARGEPTEPGPAIDVERLRLVFHEEYEHGHGYLGCQHKNQHPKSWDCFQRATEVAAEYDRLRP